MSLIINSILFPQINSNYTAENIVGLFWVPDTLAKTNVTKVDDLNNFYIETKSNANWIPCNLTCSKKAKKSYRLMLYFHANSCDLNDVQEELQLISDYCNCYVVSFEYPGYGIISNLICTPQLIEIFGLSIFKLLSLFVHNTKQIYIMGRSIGTGPATALVYNILQQKKSIGGLILHSPYISVRELINDYIPYIANFIIRDFWNTAVKISKMNNIVIAIQHAENDEIISIRHGRKIIESNSNNRILFKSSGTSKHNYYDVIDDLCVLLCELFDYVEKNNQEANLDIIQDIRKLSPILVDIKYLGITRKLPQFRLFNYITCGCADLSC